MLTFFNGLRYWKKILCEWFKSTPTFYTYYRTIGPFRNGEQNNAYTKSWSINQSLKVKDFFLHYFIVADAKFTATLFNTENSDPPPRRGLFIVHKSENSIEELERVRWVKRPCAFSAHQLPLLIHHSHTHAPLIYHVLSPSILSRGKTGLSESVVPRLQSAGRHKHTYNASDTATALNTTRTLAHSYQVLNLKLERACSGRRLNPLKATYHFFTFIVPCIIVIL